MDTFHNNRVEFNARGLWAKEKLDGQNELYRQTRRVIPYVDSLLTERLRSTTAVTSSLLGALFNEMKELIGKDINVTTEKLDKMMITAQNALDTLHDIFTDNDRVIMYVLMGVVILVSVSTLYMVYKLKKLVDKKVSQMSSLRIVPEQDQMIPLVVQYNASQ